MIEIPLILFLCLLGFAAWFILVAFCIVVHIVLEGRDEEEETR